MIPPETRLGAVYKIMDAAAIDACVHAIENTELIQYDIPRSSKVKYTPPSPTTSGYSESGSEMDNHDSGRASEMEGSPKVNPKRPDTIPLTLDIFGHIGATGSSREPVVEGKTAMKGCSSSIDGISQPSEQRAGLVTIDANTLKTLVVCLNDARMRLSRMETNMESLIQAFTLQNKVSGEAVFKLTRTILALGNDFKSFKTTNDLENPVRARKSPSKGVEDKSETSQSSTRVQVNSSSPRKVPSNSDYETATFPRFLRTNAPSSPLSVAPPSDLKFESYDNVQSEMAAKSSSANDKRPKSEYTSNEYAGALPTVKIDEISGYAVPKVPVYARVQKVVSTEEIPFHSYSSNGDKKENPPTLPRRSQELLAAINDVDTAVINPDDDVERLMNELMLPGTSPSDARNCDSCSIGESLTRISRFSEVESLMSALENSSNHSGDDKPEFSEDDEFDSDDDEHFDSQLVEKYENQSSSHLAAVSPDQGISSSIDLSVDVDADCRIEKGAREQPVSKSGRLSLLDKNAEEYSSSIIIPSKSVTSINSSGKASDDKWRKKSAPSEGKKNNVFVANYNKLFKRKGKKKRTESQTSFTFVTSPLYENELMKNQSSKSKKKLKKGVSVDSVISNQKLNSSLSNICSSREGSVGLGESRVDLMNSSSSDNGSRRSLATSQPPSNTQLLRLQSREKLTENTGDSSSIGDFDNVANNVPTQQESYDNFSRHETSDRSYSNLPTAQLKSKLPNGHVFNEEFRDTKSSSQPPHLPRKTSTAASRRIGKTEEQSFEDDVFIPSGVILDQLKREQAERYRFESDRLPTHDEPPPKPSRPGFLQGSPRSSVNQHSNGGVPGLQRNMPAPPPKHKVFSPEDLVNHEAMENLRQRQLEASTVQHRLAQQQREEEENRLWLEREERNLNPDMSPDNPSIPRGRGSSSSITDMRGTMEAPPPPSVAPSKPPRKPSRPKDEQVSGPPKARLEEVKTAPTMQLNRDNDEVYKNTMEVVKSVLGMNSITMDAKPDELFSSVKNVGAALKHLCACLDKVMPDLPEDFHREIDMAQRTTNKDLSQVINQLKLVQRFYATTQVVEYKKCLMAANQVLAIDAKNLLDVVDRARIRKIQNAQEKSKAQASDIRSGYPATEARLPPGDEPEDLYPDEDFL